MKRIHDSIFGLGEISLCLPLNMSFKDLFCIWLRCLIDLIPNRSNFRDEQSKLVVDGANGVGGIKLKVLKNSLNDLMIEIRNSGDEGGVLNEGVGADFVQKEKVVPHSFSSNDIGMRCAPSMSSSIYCLFSFI